MIFFILSFFFLQNPEVPFKPADEFEVKIDLKFKTRNISSESTGAVDLAETNVRTERLSQAQLAAAQGIGGRGKNGNFQHFWRADFFQKNKSGTYYRHRHGVRR